MATTQKAARPEYTGKRFTSKLAKLAQVGANFEWAKAALERGEIPRTQMLEIAKEYTSKCAEIETIFELDREAVRAEAVEAAS